MDALKYVNWIPGPQVVTLGGVADFAVPDGYRITDVDGARMILASLQDPVPNDLVGIFAPDSGKWMVILEYSPEGYVKSPDVTQIDTNAILKQVLNEMTGEQGQSSLASLSWQTMPTYDAKRNLLEWSFQVVTPSGKVLNQAAILFGRHGVVQITVAQPLSLTGEQPLKQVISNIRFKDGEHYTDYQKGDKIAQIGLAELISGENNQQTADSFGGTSGTVFGWIYCGLAVCLVIGGVAVVAIRRNRRHRRRHRRRPHAPVRAGAIKNQAPVIHASTNLPPIAAASTNPPTVIAKSGETNGQAAPNPVPNFSKWPKPVFQKNRRKWVCDYPKFYTRVMSELSHQSYVPSNMTIGKSNSNGHGNGRRNGDSNGQTNGHSNGHVPSNGESVNQSIKSEIEDLIAAQKILIREQKRLMEEHTRIIEEKREVVVAQTVVLKSQAGLAA